jgi:FlaA1/EpsC-like NDP-sugar epimerase
LAVTDAGVIVISVAIAQFARFGTDPATLPSEILVYSYTAVSAVLILAWFSALILFRSREPRVVGAGVEEFRRVARASTALFGTVAIVSFLLKREVARGYLKVALPPGLVSLLLTRCLWRRWLAKERFEGRLISTVLVVGSHSAAAAMAQEFAVSRMLRRSTHGTMG